MGMTEFPEWVDGRAFAAWLEGRRPDLRQAITEAESRALHRLRTDGGAGTLDLTDRICVRLNLHINEIPEWIWTDPPKRRRKKTYDPEVRDRAKRMLAGGTGVRDVSEMLGVPMKTVAHWRREVFDG